MYNHLECGYCGHVFHEMEIKTADTCPHCGKKELEYVPERK